MAATFQSNKKSPQGEHVHSAVKVSLLDDITAQDQAALMEYACDFQVTFYPNKSKGTERPPACQLRMTARKTENEKAYELFEQLDKTFTNMNDALIGSDKSGSPRFNPDGEAVVQALQLKCKTDSTKFRAEVAPTFSKRNDGSGPSMSISMWVELESHGTIKHGKDELTTYSLRNFYHVPSFDGMTIAEKRGDLPFLWNNSLGQVTVDGETTSVRKVFKGMGIPVFYYQGMMVKPIAETEDFAEKWKSSGYFEHQLKLSKFYVTALNKGEVTLETVKVYQSKGPAPKGNPRAKKTYKTWF
ncbi:hypothetical protein BDK51DRAFT_51979 [Blyttiomyces helicus]|uniref:Uncharacterized protein n=1 Tax=Blyttiomyces helicus TaxID=388810 RepID=A0A4P9WGG3_9FUNG|nr:hypothetical protein BDK51DRAFT_51979 [Blyttiomyces helicus]|eukprot:RKO91432.1 hypothetical protein BDK51DRAFT_51979 [Blyttiomyces helicus]